MSSPDYYKQHAEYFRQRAALRYVENTAVIKERQARWRLEVKTAALEHYGGLICECGEDRVAALGLDHVNGGGKQHRRRLGGGNVIYRELKRLGYPPGYKTLCSNCNWKKYLLVLRESLSQHPQAVASRSRIHALKIRLLGLLDGVFCRVCGRDDIDILTVQHKNDDGAEHRRRLGVTGGWQLYSKIIASGQTDGLECLCFSCNDAMKGKGNESVVTPTRAL